MTGDARKRPFDLDRYSPVLAEVMLSLAPGNVRAFMVASALGWFKDAAGSSERIRSGREAAGSLVTANRLPRILAALQLGNRQWQRYVTDWCQRYVAERGAPSRSGKRDRAAYGIGARSCRQGRACRTCPHNLLQPIAPPTPAAPRRAPGSRRPRPRAVRIVLVELDEVSARHLGRHEGTTKGPVPVICGDVVGEPGCHHDQVLRPGSLMANAEDLGDFEDSDGLQRFPVISHPGIVGTSLLDEELVKESREQSHDQDDKHDRYERSWDVAKHRREHPGPLQRCGLKHDTFGSGVASRRLDNLPPEASGPLHGRSAVRRRCGSWDWPTKRPIAATGRSRIKWQSRRARPQVGTGR